MTNRLSRFVSQGSGIACAAMIAASMSLHDHRLLAAAAAGTRDAMPTMHGVSHTSVARSGRVLGVTKVDFWPDMYHPLPPL